MLRAIIIAVVAPEEVSGLCAIKHPKLVPAVPFIGCVPLQYVMWGGWLVGHVHVLVGGMSRRVIKSPTTRYNSTTTGVT